MHLLWAILELVVQVLADVFGELILNSLPRMLRNLRTRWARRRGRRPPT